MFYWFVQHGLVKARLTERKKGYLWVNGREAVVGRCGTVWEAIEALGCCGGADMDGLSEWVQNGVSKVVRKEGRWMEGGGWVWCGWVTVER